MDLDKLYAILGDTTVQLRKGKQVVQHQEGNLNVVEVFAMPPGVGQSQISIASSPEVMQLRRNADMARRKNAAAMMEALRPSWQLGVRQTVLDKAGRRLDEKATQGFGRENK